jgi:hypothetical protein
MSRVARLTSSLVNSEKALEFTDWLSWRDDMARLRVTERCRAGDREIDAGVEGGGIRPKSAAMVLGGL